MSVTSDEPDVKVVPPHSAWSEINTETIIGLMKPFYLALTEEPSGMVEVLSFNDRMT
jgi:hypothetical protein